MSLSSPPQDIISLKETQAGKRAEHHTDLFKQGLLPNLTLFAALSLTGESDSLGPWGSHHHRATTVKNNNKRDLRMMCFHYPAYNCEVFSAADAHVTRQHHIRKFSGCHFTAQKKMSFKPP